MSALTVPVGLALVLALASAAPRAAATEIENGSFETGDFSGWIAEDAAGARVPLQVSESGQASPDFDSFRSSPSHGAFSAVHSFDSSEAGARIRIAQELDVTADGTRIEFDYRAGWDLETFCGQCADRRFAVHVEPAGGGPALRSLPILELSAQNRDFDTGLRAGAVDLSEFAGQRVRLGFDFQVPDAYSGPAFFELDHVRVAPAAWLASGAVRRRIGKRVHWAQIVGLQQPELVAGGARAGLRGAAQPWTSDASESHAHLDLRSAALYFRVRDLSLAAGPGMGTTGGLTALRATLICDADASAGDAAVWLDSPPVSLSRDGSAAYHGSLGRPLPDACLSEPDLVLVLRP